MINNNINNNSNTITVTFIISFERCLNNRPTQSAFRGLSPTRQQCLPIVLRFVAFHPRGSSASRLFPCTISGLSPMGTLSQLQALSFKTSHLGPTRNIATLQLSRRTTRFIIISKSTTNYQKYIYISIHNSLSAIITCIVKDSTIIHVYIKVPT